MRVGPGEFYPLAAYLFGMLALVIFIVYVDLFSHRVSPDDWGKDDGAPSFKAVARYQLESHLLQSGSTFCVVPAGTLALS
ncbi:hypothetical protein SAMN03159406_03016 [Rhizobium sp. NFR03]|nr:hypothetical protein SAMN03159406_03016 [Rhizobium sp. NFR03]